MAIRKKHEHMNRFVRFGKIDSYQKQRIHVIKDKPYDLFDAPENRGFFAMPYKFQEYGLLNSLMKSQEDNFPKKSEPKYCDADYEKCRECPHKYPKKYKLVNVPEGMNPWQLVEMPYFCTREEAYERQIKKIMSKIRRTFSLKDSDLIWHHLDDELPPNEVEKRSGAWGLTTVAAFKKAISKLIAECNRFQIGWEYELERKHDMERKRFIYGVNNITWPLRYYHFEVFIPPGTIK